MYGNGRVCPFLCVEQRLVRLWEWDSVRCFLRTRRTDVPNVLMRQLRELQRAVARAKIREAKAAEKEAKAAAAAAEKAAFEAKILAKRAADAKGR